MLKLSIFFIYWPAIDILTINILDGLISLDFYKFVKIDIFIVLYMHLIIKANNNSMSKYIPGYNIVFAKGFIIKECDNYTELDNLTQTFIKAGLDRNIFRIITREFKSGDWYQLVLFTDTGNHYQLKKDSNCIEINGVDCILDHNVTGKPDEDDFIIHENTLHNFSKKNNLLFSVSLPFDCDYVNDKVKILSLLDNDMRSNEITKIISLINKDKQNFVQKIFENSKYGLLKCRYSAVMTI